MALRKSPVATQTAPVPDPAVAPPPDPSPPDGAPEAGGDGNEDPGSEADTLVAPDPPVRANGRPSQPVPVPMNKPD